MDLECPKGLFPWWCHWEVVECVRDGTQWERGLLVTEVTLELDDESLATLFYVGGGWFSSPMSCFPIGLLPPDLKVMRQLDHWLETEIKPGLLSKFFFLVVVIVVQSWLKHHILWILGTMVLCWSIFDATGHVSLCAACWPKDLCKVTHLLLTAVLFYPHFTNKKMKHDEFNQFIQSILANKCMCWAAKASTQTSEFLFLSAPPHSAQSKRKSFVAHSRSRCQ